MKTLILTLTLVLSLFSISSANASNTAPKGLNVATAYILNNKVYGQNLDTLMQPASTQKLVTALATTLFFGKDYRIKTSLLINKNDLKKINKTTNTLNGDITISFSGDPSLTHGALKNLIKRIKDFKISKINGNVYLDVSKFKGNDKPQGTSWNDSLLCFSAKTSAIIINKNCSFAKLQKTPLNQIADVSVPKSSLIKVSSEAQAVKAATYNRECSLDAKVYEKNHYHLEGCLPQNQEINLLFAIDDPYEFGINHVQKCLEELNIKVNGRIVTTTKIMPDLEEIAIHYSKSLHALITHMLQDSDNLYADALIKLLGYSYYKKRSNFSLGIQAAHAVLKKEANIDLDNSHLVDGSGLSHYDLITARTMLKILNYIKLHNKELKLIEALAISGKVGTIRGRRSSRVEPLKEHVYAKSGTLQNTTNLAGFVLNKHNEFVPFVIFTNNVSYNKETLNKIKKGRGKVLAPHVQYERDFLMSLYNNEVFN